MVETMKLGEIENSNQEKLAIERFEQTIDYLGAGGTDRKTAIRWLFEAADCNGDWEHFEWQNGLPFGYLTKEM
jgi:hypothetical protein